MTGLGAATADTFYGAVVAFSITFISDFLLRYQLVIGIVGVLFLLGFGLKIFFEKPSMDIHVDADQQSLFSQYISALLLTLTNLMTIVSFTAIFTGINVSYPVGHYSEPFLLTIGVFIGSSLWWLTLSQLVNIFKKRVTNTILHRINKISAGIMFLSAVLLVIHLMRW